MILIKQDSKIDRQKLEHLLNKYGHSEYELNEQLIIDDINRVNTWLKESVTTLRMENLKKIKNYLEGLLKKAKQGPFHVDWMLKGNKIMSSPVEIRKLKTYNIQATDYISADGSVIVSLDYTELVNIIAFELSYKDFDYTTSDIEEKLSNIGIISVYDCTVLSEIIDKYTYDKALTMRVGDSSYIAANRKQMYTYFGDKLDLNGYYRQVVEESCATAISIIVQNILSEVQHIGGSIGICGIFEDAIYFSIPDDKDKKIKDILTSSVVVRAFGRKFDVLPKMQIY